MNNGLNNRMTFYCDTCDCAPVEEILSSDNFYRCKKCRTKLSVCGTKLSVIRKDDEEA